MPRSLDFAAIAAAALSSAERLVPLWLADGRRSGHEWQARNPTRSDNSIGSFSVNLTTGAWADFASGDKGGDLVSLRAFLSGTKQADAAREIADMLRIDLAAPPPSRPAPAVVERTPWVPVIPVPENAPGAPVAHIKRGPPERTWCYRDRDGRLLGYVYRFRTSDGGKEILPVVWAHHAQTGEHGWRWMQWAAPRPMYGLHRLTDKPVLIVEGEKCADAAHEALAEHFDVISWPGGGKAVDKVDWSPLAGRSVLIWPDCDAQLDKDGIVLAEALQPGIVAAERIAKHLLELGCPVRIVKIPAPGEKPGGWDVADAIADGWSVGQLRQLLKLQRAPVCVPRPTPAARARLEPREWESLLLRRRGEVVACLANVVLILANHEAWQGVVAFDEFSMRTLKRAPVPGEGEGASAGEWTDVDTSRATIWLTNTYGMTPASVMVDEAVELCGKNNGFHPVREYLSALTWDSTPRLDRWLSDFMGVAFDDYSQRVARWFLIAMVARVMRPGVKFDYCLVLEGRQGLRKSSALRVLAGEWFSDTELDLTNKDAMSAIRGKLLHEFSEMGSIARAEATRQKSFLSRQVDEFRPTYGRREIRCPRQLVFAGTTNDWQWNKDTTGGRRFWPVEITGEIDTDGLAAVRDQLFAEAFACYQAGERFWPNAEEQRELFDPQQLRREAEDAFFDPIHDWIEHLPKEEFTLHELLAESLKLDAGRITRDVMTRAGMLLHKLGCRRVERRNGVSRFVYLVPSWSDYGKAQARQQQVRSSDGPMPF